MLRKLYNSLTFKTLSPSKFRSSLAFWRTKPLKSSTSQILDFSKAIVGTAIYLSTNTRVDICFAVQWLARQFQGPYKEHLKASRNLLRYLNTFKNLSILYSKKGNLVPIGYCDSDFAGDKATAKSTYSYVFMLANGPISWKSKRGSTIALSTLEAEYIAITEATREIQWLRGLFTEIQRPISQPTTLYNDNQGAISTASDPKHHSPTKHTLLRFSYVREEAKKGTMRVEFLETAKMVADGLTKPLPGPKFLNFLGQLNLQLVSSKI